MNDVKIKQQIVEKIKSSTNILVTVSTNPSVDALSAALGLTVMLNKLDKHATAVFSGSIPPAITFLDPDKTFETTTDSLRDFIIALDKEKADHLRYKVDGDVVKIFITPFRTTITSDDLEFSQGDYNVELVLALGVDSQANLDSALEAHGRILHDATVVTLSAGEQVSQLGSLDWRDEQASSLSEMLVGLGDALKADKPIFDKQISTAFLTGIVAATDRFSNTKTSSKAMTVAAQLMAAGADQQLIAAKLQASHEIGELVPKAVTSTDEIPLADNVAAKLDKTTQPPVVAKDGEMIIKHDKLDEAASELKTKNQEDAAGVAEQVLADRIKTLTPSVMPAPVVKPADVVQPDQPLRGAVDWVSAVDEPLLGGTLNATTEQAEEDTRRDLANDQNKTILTHSYLNGTPTYDAPINGAAQPNGEADVDIFAGSPNQPASVASVVGPAPVVDPVIPPTDLTGQNQVDVTLADLDSQNRGHAAPDDALAAVHATFNDQQLSNPAPSILLPQPPPLPDFSTMPPPHALPGFAPESTPPLTERLGDIFPSQPTPTEPPPSGDDDPGQFKIPGQS